MGCITAQRKSGTCEDTKICSFTQDWYVCLARGSILRYEGVSIDTDAITGQDYFKTDIGPEVAANYQNVPRRLKIIFMCFLSHCFGYDFYFIFLGCLLGCERKEELFRSLLGTPLVLLLNSTLYVFIYDFCDNYNV